MNIFLRMQSALSTLGIPCVANHNLLATAGDLPDVFAVYSLVSSMAQNHADDTEQNRFYRVQVAIYSNIGLGDLPDVETPMLAAGFMRGPERPAPEESNSNYFGIIKEFTFLEGASNA